MSDQDPAPTLSDLFRLAQVKITAGGQRSMQAVLETYNAGTRSPMTPADGWRFMASLAETLIEHEHGRRGDYIDLSVYAVLRGEAVTVPLSREPPIPPAKVTESSTIIWQHPLLPNALEFCRQLRRPGSHWHLLGEQIWCRLIRPEDPEYGPVLEGVQRETPAE